MDVRFDRVSKTYPGVRALDNVTLDVRAGSIHALLGENGAGKSTLLRILGGATQPDRGEVLLDGARRTLRSPREAIAAGVAVIHQELQLVPQLSVAENLLLGRMPTRCGLIRRRRSREFAAELLRALDPSIDPAVRVGRLPVGQRQLVEIARALGSGARVLAFDEPTSSLSAHESHRLFRVIRELKERDCAVIYVSHRLDEVFSLCDAASVLRDGTLVHRFDPLAGVTADDLTRAMVGRDLAAVFSRTPHAPGDPVLELRGVRGAGLRRPISLTVRAGEIVSLFGLIGAGRTELLRIIVGASRRTAGSMQLAGAEYSPRSVRHAIAAGVVLCPEDRKREGIIPIASVAENLNLSARRLHTRGGFLSPAWERSHAESMIARLRVRTPSRSQQVRKLSGGNQQKVILGRWLSLHVRALLLDEPTRGVDVGAKSEIYSIMHELARNGAAILMASSEMPEALGVADRVIVMRGGAISGELTRDQASEQAALRLALPQSAAEAGA